MELSHRGVEGESLLLGERGAVVMPQRSQGWEGDGEKAPFLRNEPVKLTPAWEGSNLPNDTLNLKGITMDLAPPKDKWNLIYITLLFHGLGTLIAWNAFITAKDYFMEYKLAGTSYADTFMVNIGYASQLPNLLFNWFNVFVTIGGDLSRRIVFSVMMEVLIFVVTVVLAMMDSTSWPATFFWITMVSVFALNVFNAVFQNSVFGVAARLPSKYTGALILGTNVCGTVVVLLDWVSSTSGNLRTSAIYYFIGGMLVLLICFDTFFALPLNRFYRYYDTLQQRTMQANPALAATEPAPRTPWLHILKIIWVQLYNVWIVFVVSLTCFPAVQSEIISTASPPFLGHDFVRITCFLTFNFTAMLGCISANCLHFPSRRWLCVATTLRIIFIPLLLLCNYHPPHQVRTLAVFIKSDWLYWLIAILLGWTSGHCSSLGMQYVSSNVAPEHASKAGMLGGAVLVTGLLTGIGLSSLAPLIVTADMWKTT